jgi:SAM-dependent methyltransferase
MSTQVTAFMMYQDPLAWLIGVEGVALLDAWAGRHDRAFTEARLAEIRRLLDDDKLRNRGVPVERDDTVTSYGRWSATYDADPGGAVFATEEPVVAEFLGSRAPGVALDAACGTGRYAEFLAARGHRVIGVDSSPDMLARARERVPGGEFHLGELNRLPLPDDSVDVIVCTLALNHVQHLEPVLAEFARVLRPGGDLVISDAHPVWSALGPAGVKGPWTAGRRLGPEYRHQLGDYLRPALRLGLQVRRCEELYRHRQPGEPWPAEPLPEPDPSAEPGDWLNWPWSLMGYLPLARRVYDGLPALLLWHFQQPRA